jgi:hypothetical protein
MTQAIEFRRIVMGLPYNMPVHGVRLATEFARLLRLDLYGLFVEEESLRGLAALPFAREFQPLGGGWRPLDIDQLSRDLEMAAKNAEKAFAAAARTLQTGCRFEVVRGSMAETIAAISGAGDIVLITEPEGAADRMTAQFRSILDVAMRSAAAVLLVPCRIARQSGVVVAIATEPGDPSIEVAKAVASAANAELVVVETFKTAGRPPATLSEIGAALGNVIERLIVVSRTDESPLAAIAALRRVPILIVEPERESRKADRRTGSATRDQN